MKKILLSVFLFLASITVLAVNGSLLKVRVYYVHNGENLTVDFTDQSGNDLIIDEGTGEQLSFTVYATGGTPNYYYFGACGSIGWEEEHYSSSTSFDLDPESNYSWYLGMYFLGVDEEWMMIGVTEEQADKPDLVVSEPDPDSNPPFDVGENVEWEVIITNIGDGSTNSGAYVKFYLGNSPSDFSKYIGQESFGILDPNESTTEHESYTFEVSDVGTRYLNVWVDQGNDIIESNENNNKNYFGSFSVNPSSSITVTYPSNSGINLQAGQVVNIQWTGSNITGNVKIELFKGGNLNGTIANSVAYNSSPYPWAILSGQTPGSDYKIKITSLDNNNIYDFSNNNFTISAEPNITVTQPNGGEEWMVGTTYGITWNDNISENVKIEVYKNNTFFETIANSTASDGSYPWPIPPLYQTGTDFKIKISLLSE
jgi:hypothetical protein